PIIAGPVRKAGAGDDRLEAVGLRVRPHRHEPAIAVTDQAEAVVVDGGDLFERVDTRKNVAQVATAEVADVRAREGFALAVAPARVGEELIIAGAGEIGAVRFPDEGRRGGG